MDTPQFNCMGDNCNMRPVLCPACSYTSTEKDNVKFCKMCRVTEKMKNYEPAHDEMEVDTKHTIELVASVSFDKTKKQFNYDNFNPEVFGANKADYAGMISGQKQQADHAAKVYKNAEGYSPSAASTVLDDESESAID